MKRAAARYERTFFYASRGTGKTTNIVSDRCNKGILFPGEVVGYYAPTEKQAAPIASKAFSTYKRNSPLLAAHWSEDSNAMSSFKLSTKNGSMFTMSVPRGVDTSSLIAEECGQEDKVDGVSPLGAVNLQVHYITSASRKENPAFQVCEQIRQEMKNGGSAFAGWVPWQAVVLCRMKSYNYYRNLKRQLTADQFQRECESKCTGSIQNPIIRDSALLDSRTVMLMEDRHCGDKDVFYILGYDVSSRDVSGNALTATAVLKCEKNTNADLTVWDHYRKSCVYITAFC